MFVERLRTLYSDGKFAEAWGLYSANSALDIAEFHLYGALAAWRQNQHWQAKRAVEMALALPSEGGVLGRIRFVAGSLYREIGDYADALHFLLALIEDWNQYPEERVILEGAAWHNLALTRYSRREFEESVICNRQAARVFLQWGNVSDYAKAQRNAAWSLCFMGDGEMAAKLLQEVEQKTAGDDDMAHQTLGWAFVALVLGKNDSCLELVEELMTATAIHPDVMVQAHWLAGHAHLAKGDVEEARRLARQAQDIALDAGDARLTTDVQRLITRIEDANKEGA